jgi:hypothetical protein
VSRLAEYGFSAPFLNAHKDVKNIVKRAIAGQWEIDKFLDELKKTAWWKRNSDAQRRYDVMRVDNPRELARQVAVMRGSIRRMMLSMGLRDASPRRMASWARSAVRQGWGEDELRWFIGSRYRHGDTNRGLVGRAADELVKTAADYGLALTPANRNSFIRRIAQGVNTIEDFKPYFQNQAMAMYPAAKAFISQGFTVRQILDPFLAQAAEELGRAPSTMNIRSALWTAPLSYRAKPGADPQMMTNDEWIAKLRTDVRYGFDKGQNAQRAAAQFATAIAEMFGNRG